MQYIIKINNTKNSDYIGRGFNCVGNNLVNNKDIYPLKLMSFEGKKFYVPNNSQVILKQQYDDYETLPPVSERVLRHCKELIPNLDNR